MSDEELGPLLWPIPDADRRRQLLRDALSPLPAGEAAQLFPVLDDLLASILTTSELLHPDADNPVEHHTLVLKHMMEIATGEDFNQDDVRRTAAISILHDNWPARRIPYEMRVEAPTGVERTRLDDIHRVHRLEHMTKGSANARRRLAELNERRGRVEFTDDDIDVICGVISVHDNPSIGQTIPESNWIAGCFREADRLWMQSVEGVRADLARKGIAIPTTRQCIDQAARNLKSYLAERALYGPDDRGFIDDATPFRTRTGYGIFQRYRRMWDDLAPADA